MNRNRKILVSIALLSVAASVISVYAFTALQVTTTLNVKEPLSIHAAAGTNDFATSLSCTIAGGSLTATCTGDVTAGDVGGITVTVDNAGHEALTVTPTIVSSNTDVTVAAPSAGSVPAAGSLSFAFDVTVSPGASAPNTVTLTLSFAR